MFLKSGITLRGKRVDGGDFYATYLRMHGSGTGADGVINADGVLGALVSIHVYTYSVTGILIQEGLTNSCGIYRIVVPTTMCRSYRPSCLVRVNPSLRYAGLRRSLTYSIRTWPLWAKFAKSVSRHDTSRSKTLVSGQIWSLQELLEQWETSVSTSNTLRCGYSQPRASSHAIESTRSSRMSIMQA